MANMTFSPVSNFGDQSLAMVNLANFGDYFWDNFGDNFRVIFRDNFGG